MSAPARLLEKYGERAINLARKRYQRGAKMELVGRALGVRREHAYRFVRVFGWQRRPGAKPARFKQSITLADKTTLRRMMEAGRPLDEMAAALGRSVAATRKIMDEIPVQYTGGGHKSWFPAEDRHLRLLVQQGKTNRQIARIMGRSVNSITSRRYLVLGLKTGKMKRWTQSMDRQLLAWHQAGLSHEAIAFRLDRTAKATTNRLCLLRQTMKSKTQE